MPPKHRLTNLYNPPPTVPTQAALEQTLSSLRLQLDALEAERARLAETERELVLERQREQVGRGVLCAMRSCGCGSCKGGP